MQILRAIWQRVLGTFRLIWRWLLRLALLAAVLILGLLAPVAYTEIACRAPLAPSSYQPQISDPAWQRPEARTLTTYPEWHIVYAYEDYAKVIASKDPHSFSYLAAIKGFWTSLCPLAKLAGNHGGFDSTSKMTIYTIGVSFTAELLLKATYEETLGRIATWARGPQKAHLDQVSAEQAANYAEFLHQTPWYLWDFDKDKAELNAKASGSWRDLERRLALGVEYGAKAAYAWAIAGAVAATGNDQLRMQSIVKGLPPSWFDAEPEVQVIETRGSDLLIETPRYAAFTALAQRIAAAGGDFAEIAGNDEILISMLAPTSDPAMLHSAPRQGFDDWRQLALLPVSDLAGALRALSSGPRRLEHIYDY